MQAFSSTTNVVYLFFYIEKFPRNKNNMEYTPPKIHRLNWLSSQIPHGVLQFKERNLYFTFTIYVSQVKLKKDKTNLWLIA